jgi:hypothetical protein
LTSKIIRPFCCVSLLLTLLQGVVSFADTVDDVAETRANMLEVVQLRETLAAEKRAWREQQDLMEGQLRLDKQALQLLETQLADLKPRLESLTTERTRLTSNLEESLSIVEFWKGKLEILKQRIAGILPRFPPRLRNELTLKLRDAVAIDYTTDNSQIKRAMDICLEIISDANEYQREIHFLTEIHKLGDDRRGEFKVVYLGLSGGYYYSLELQQAGVISWDGSDWQWLERPELLESLVAFGEVLSGQTTPRYLAVPFEFMEGTAQ